MDLDDVVDELYTGDPSAFTGRRDQLAKQAAKDGERDLATAIRALRRPSASAAVLNALARQAPDELAAYLELGEQLRQAQAQLAGDRMRELSHQRQQAGAALVDRAVALTGADVTAAVRREVDETLRAAVADPAAAEVIASGRLTRALSYAGFGEVDITAATATPLSAKAAPGKRGGGPDARAPSPSPPAAAVREERTRPQADDATQQRAAPAKRSERTSPDDAAARALDVLAEQQAAARDRLRRAQEQADAATVAVAAADDELAEAERDHVEAVARVTELTEQLAQARADVRRLQRGEQAARTAAAQARRAVRDTERELASAERHARALIGD